MCAGVRVFSVCCCTQLGFRLLHIMHCTRTALALLGVGVARRGMAVASFAFQTKLHNFVAVAAVEPHYALQL